MLTGAATGAVRFRAPCSRKRGYGGVLEDARVCAGGFWVLEGARVNADVAGYSKVLAYARVGEKFNIARVNAGVAGYSKGLA